MTQPAPTSGRRALRSSAGLAGLAFSVILAAFLLGDAVVRGSWAQMLLLAPWVLLGLWVIYEATAASFLRLDDEQLVVQNMLRRTS
ncbi:MAG: PH domain-containing protein, partial [Microbacterium sp.]|nr:PH domain-containing protein [Microbacterium sp.]